MIRNKGFPLVLWLSFLETAMNDVNFDIRVLVLIAGEDIKAQGVDLKVIKESLTRLVEIGRAAEKELKRINA